MDEIDVATLTTALLILFFFHQIGQLWSLGDVRQSIAGLARRTWSQNVVVSELILYPLPPAMT